MAQLFSGDGDFVRRQFDVLLIERSLYVREQRSLRRREVLRFVCTIGLVLDVALTDARVNLAGGVGTEVAKLCPFTVDPIDNESAEAARTVFKIVCLATVHVRRAFHMLCLPYGVQSRIAVRSHNSMRLDVTSIF